MDINNFLKNGLANLKLDPDKINPMLSSVPFKLVEGTISSIKLSIDKKIEVIVDKISVVVYVDDHSQFQPSLGQKSTFVVGEY